MNETETPFPTPQADGASHPTRESFLGLAEDVRFKDVIPQKLVAISEANSPEISAPKQAILEAHGVDMPPAAAPEQLWLEKLTEEDWEAVRTSENPLFTLYGATNYRNQVAETEFTTFGNKRRHEDPREGHKGIENRAMIRSLPLVHGLSADAFVKLIQGGTMQSNKTRFKESGDDALAFHSAGVGATNLQDRELGLDQYVFFDYGRPAVNHKQQAEITLAVDPAVMHQPGVFMTERDFYDVLDVKKYMSGLTSPEYFEETALLRIHNTEVERGEVRSGGSHSGYVRYNTLSQWLTGKDGDPDGNNYPMFSTYEVKVPDPPGVLTDAIRRVIVRDQETFEQLQQTLGDRFELIHEPNLHAGGQRIATPDGDPRNDPIDPGNYDLLQIPGSFEQEMEKLIEADFQERSAALASLPEEDKEKAVVVFGGTEPTNINGQDVRTRIDGKSNPYLIDDHTTAIYDSMDALHKDVHAGANSTGGFSFTTRAGQPAWFFDPLMTSNERIATPSGTCVVAVIERSKANPRIARFLDTLPLSLEEIKAA